MSILDRVLSGFGLQRKISEAGPIIARLYANQSNGIYTKRNFAQYSEDAYKRNVIAYKAIGSVARACAFIPLTVHMGKREVQEGHPLVKLLKRPNPWQGGAAWMEALVAYYLLSGNTYIEGVGPDGQPPLELYTLRPDRTRVVAGSLGVRGFIYEANGAKKEWESDEITGESPILHIKSFNPLDDWYGLSPVEAAAYAVDQHNMAGEWNQGLLQNAARPSGALVYSSATGSTLSEAQFTRLKEEINSAYSGSRNAGRPMILEGGLDWKQMSLTPAELDWINGKAVSAREIALVFGVPPQMLGIPGDNTYSNYQEARQSFYEDTVIPLLDSFLDSINYWFRPAFGEELTIKMNLDDLPALAAKREKRWTAVQTATWLTINEKREATGYEVLPDKEADVLFVPSGLMPLAGSTDVPDGDETLPEEEPGEGEEPEEPEEEGDEEKPPKKPVKE